MNRWRPWLCLSLFGHPQLAGSLHSASFQACHENAIGFELAKAGCLEQSKTRNTQFNLQWRPWRVLCNCYGHALSCTELAFRHATETHLEFKVAHKDEEKKKLAIYRAWPWISNCWEWDPNSGLSGLESSALTTRPRRLGANLRRDATSRLLFLDQSVLADFDPRKKKTTGFKTRSLSGTSNDGRRNEIGWLHCTTTLNYEAYHTAEEHATRISLECEKCDGEKQSRNKH